MYALDHNQKISEQVKRIGIFRVKEMQIISFKQLDEWMNGGGICVHD